MSKLEYDLENFVRLCHLHDKVAKLEQALAEKDAALAKAVEEIAELNVRVDALRRWLRERDAAYQQLMEKAIRFAERLDAVDKNSSVHWNDVDEFLKSPEVQAWKEQRR